MKKGLKVNLQQFRIVNHLTQAELAKEIKLSRGLISLIELNKSNMSASKVEELIKLSEYKHWDSRPLFPSCWRLSQLDDYAKATEGWKQVIQHNVISSDYCISKTDWEKYCHGILVIDEVTANIICRRYPQVNFEWILNGTSPMLSSEEKVNNKTDNLILSAINSKLDIVITLLQDLKVIFSETNINH